jgi:sulfite dehydrogenase (quinone) subunit SoeA
MVNHERRPGIGPLAGWRGDGTVRTGAARRTPTSSSATSRTAASSRRAHPDEARFIKPWNMAYQDWAVRSGFYDAPQPYLLELWSNRCAASRWRPRATAAASRPTTCATASAWRWTRCPSGIRRSRRRDRPADFPLHALTQRPMAMYHSWGIAERLAAPDPRHEPALRADRGLGGPGLSRGRLGAGDLAPWRDHGARRPWMAALNPHTVWTWNAIGKRKGAWALDPDAPEATGASC